MLTGYRTVVGRGRAEQLAGLLNGADVLAVAVAEEALVAAG
jgi:hypothetical protein